MGGELPNIPVGKGSADPLPHGVQIQLVVDLGRKAETTELLGHDKGTIFITPESAKISPTGHKMAKLKRNDGQTGLHRASFIERHHREGSRQASVEETFLTRNRHGTDTENAENTCKHMILITVQ